MSAAKPRCPKVRKESAAQKRHSMRVFKAIYGAILEHSEGSLHPVGNPISLTFSIQRAIKDRRLAIRRIPEARQ